MTTNARPALAIGGLFIFYFFNVYLNSDSSTVQKYNYKEYRIEGPENGKPKKKQHTMLGQSSNYAFDYATIMPNMLNYAELCSVPLCIHAVHRGLRNHAYTHGHALSIIFV